MPQLAQITPIVPVSDIEATVAFYTDTLDFKLVSHTKGTHPVLIRDNAGISLVHAGGDERTLEATRQNISAYVWVKDLDALWRDLEPGLDALSKGRVRAPFTQDYGMREFHVKDPDGFLLFFGEDADTTGDA